MPVKKVVSKKTVSVKIPKTEPTPAHNGTIQKQSTYDPSVSRVVPIKNPNERAKEKYVENNRFGIGNLKRK